MELFLQILLLDYLLNETASQRKTVVRFCISNSAQDPAESTCSSSSTAQKPRYNTF
ncbi:hypothetical protein M758_5G178200 [Ceratodon purpureus]|uniref:Uncharacterized protein n=1 Tax=Ceratodon purpureus TaxID=3225 RepID=A0A8T0I4H2_CERPU|nr:hypothetical protein KC19_5G185400 [Ceratodon purpureus]KAG0617276.1 hypothetical protein M758_5G178200 [Ceratodon purpureus]